jgi:hypothetical protein
MFCHLSKQGKKGSIRHTTAGGVLSLLYGQWAVARHVALDPLPEILGGGLLGLLTLDKEHFTRSFAGEKGWDCVGTIAEPPEEAHYGG